MRRIMMLVVVALVMAVGALPALADDVPRHQHYLVTEKGKVVRVGPNVCANPNAQQGFNNFHHNVHVEPDHPANVMGRGCTAPPPSS